MRFFLSCLAAVITLAAGAGVSCADVWSDAYARGVLPVATVVNAGTLTLNGYTPVGLNAGATNDYAGMLDLSNASYTTLVNTGGGNAGGVLQMVSPTIVDPVITGPLTIGSVTDFNDVWNAWTVGSRLAGVATNVGSSSFIINNSGTLTIGTGAIGSFNMMGGSANFGGLILLVGVQNQAVVPEPGTFVMGVVAVGGLMGRRTSRKRDR